MKRVVYLSLLISCLLLPQICHAEHGNTTAKQIQKACESDSMSNQSLCLGFINGAVQTYLGMQNLTTVYKNKVCLPETVSLKQLRDLFIKYASNLREDQFDMDADVVLMGALVMEFPCLKK